LGPCSKKKQKRTPRSFTEPRDKSSRGRTNGPFQGPIVPGDTLRAFSCGGSSRIAHPRGPSFSDGCAGPRDVDVHPGRYSTSGLGQRLSLLQQVAVPAPRLPLSTFRSDIAAPSDSSSGRRPRNPVRSGRTPKPRLRSGAAHFSRVVTAARRLGMSSWGGAALVREGGGRCWAPGHESAGELKK